MHLCSLCNNFRGHTLSSVVRHIGEIHRYDPNLHIQCGVEQCLQTYNNFESYRSQVNRKHKNVLHAVDNRSDDCGRSRDELAQNDDMAANEEDQDQDNQKIWIGMSSRTRTEIRI